MILQKDNHFLHYEYIHTLPLTLLFQIVHEYFLVYIHLLYNAV